MLDRSDDFSSTDRPRTNTFPMVRLTFHCVNFEPGPALCVQQQLNMQQQAPSSFFYGIVSVYLYKEFLKHLVLHLRGSIVKWIGGYAFFNNCL